MHKRGSKAVPFMICSIAVVSGCSSTADIEGAGTQAPPSEATKVSTPPSWDTFRQYAEKHVRIVNGEKVYIVEWDIPLWEWELYDYYMDHYVETRKSTVDVLVSGGGDNIWKNFKELDLTYCISTSFNSNHARMQQEMDSATWAWMRVANVRFVYKPSEDGNCTDANANVEIPVVPDSGSGACAFFPDQNGRQFCSSAGRALIINISDIDSWPTTPTWGKSTSSSAPGYETYPNLSTLGALRHELGHILGLRHEQIREANNAIPFTLCAGEVPAPGPHRALTDYDVDSAMHYPWCDGIRTSAQLVTERDGEGARALYTQPAAWYIPVL